MPASAATEARAISDVRMDMMLSCWVECFTRILVRAPQPRVQAAVAAQRAFNQSVMAVTANAVFDPGAASRHRRFGLAPLFAPLKVRFIAGSLCS